MNALVLPDLTDPDAAGFWAASATGKLVVQACGECGQVRFPPHPGCPACGSAASRWRPVSGHARLWSFIVVHAPTLPAFATEVPFPVALVELDDAPGLRMVGNVVASPDAKVNSVPPELLRIGRGMKVCFRQVDDVALPCWIPDA
jgi:uncharacterized OB-fold protein